MKRNDHPFYTGDFDGMSLFHCDAQSRLEVVKTSDEDTLKIILSDEGKKVLTDTSAPLQRTVEKAAQSRLNRLTKASSKNHPSPTIPMSMPKAKPQPIETRSEKRKFIKSFTPEERDQRVEDLVDTVKQIEELKQTIADAKKDLKESQALFSKQSHELSEGGVEVEEHCRVEIDYDADERRVITPLGELLERGPITNSDRQGNLLE